MSAIVGAAPFALEPRPTAARTRIVWLALLAAGGIAASIHAGGESVAQASIAWGVALVFGGLLVAFFGERRFDLFSPLSFVALSFAFFYGVSGILAFTTVPGFYPPVAVRAYPWFAEAGAVCYTGLLGFVLGYGVRGVARAGAVSTLLSWRPSAHQLKLLWIIFFGAAAAVLFLRLSHDAFLQTSVVMLPPQMQAVVSILIVGSFIATPLAVSAALNGRGVFWWVAAAISLAGTLYFGFGSASKGGILVPLVLAGLAWNYSRHHFSRGWTALFLALGVVVSGFLFPLNMLQRQILLFDQQFGSGTASSYEAFGAAAKEFFALEPDDAMDLSARSMASRLSNLQVVANILRYQELGGERHWGASYALIFPAFVPRFLWPSKPSITISQSFGVEVGYGEPEFYDEGKLKTYTSVGITRMGEIIYNFPLVLAPIGMFLFGLLFRWLYEVFRNGARVSPELAVGVYALWWFTLFAQGGESNFASVFSGAVKATLLLVVLFWLLGCQKCRPADESRF